MDVAGFLSLREKRFFPENDVGGRDLPQNVRCCLYGSNDTFSDSLAQSVQKLWSLNGLPATIVADAGV